MTDGKKIGEKTAHCYPAHQLDGEPVSLVPISRALLLAWMCDLGTHWAPDHSLVPRKLPPP